MKYGSDKHYLMEYIEGRELGNIVGAHCDAPQQIPMVARNASSLLKKFNTI